MGHLTISPYPNSNLLHKIINELIDIEIKIIDKYGYKFIKRKTKEKNIYLDDGNNLYTELIFDC
jgi:hypothetical protein